MFRILCLAGRVERSLILRADPRLGSAGVSAPASCIPLHTSILLPFPPINPSSSGQFNTKQGLYSSDQPNFPAASLLPQAVAFLPLWNSSLQGMSLWIIEWFLEREGPVLSCWLHGGIALPTAGIAAFAPLSSHFGSGPACQTSELRRGSDWSGEISPAKMQPHNLHSRWNGSHQDNKDG